MLVNFLNNETRSNRKVPDMLPNSDYLKLCETTSIFYIIVMFSKSLLKKLADNRKKKEYKISDEDLLLIDL